MTIMNKCTGCGVWERLYVKAKNHVCYECHSKALQRHTKEQKAKKCSDTSEYEKYLDYLNNFLTVSAFAEHYELTESEAIALIEKGRMRNIERL